MISSRVLVPLALLSLASGLARAEPLIDRPLTLPAGAFDLTLHGAYTNWGNGTTAGGGSNSLTGESLALGADFGATPQAQVGVAIALPINPGAAFGSLLASGAFALDKTTAVRADVGFESIGVNGDNTAGTSHTSRYFAALGARIKVPLSPTLAFVTGRTGAVHFGHFNNLGDNGTGIYVGASALTEAGADNLIFSTGNNNSSTNIGINLPAGLLLQPDPRFAVTLQAGYSAAISFPSCPTGSPCSTDVLHFLPVGIEAVVSPTPQLDIGGRFFLDGYLAESGGNSSSSNGPGFFDLRALMLWFRFRA